MERFYVAGEVAVVAEDALVLENVFSTGDAVGQGVLAGGTVQVVSVYWVVAEGTGSLFEFRLGSHRTPRNLLDPALVLLRNLLPVLRTHQHARPVVRNLFQVRLRSLDHCCSQDVHRVLSELRYVLANTVQQPRSSFVLPLLYYPTLNNTTFSLCCTNAESSTYLIFQQEFLYYSLSYL